MPTPKEGDETLGPRCRDLYLKYELGHTHLGTPNGHKNIAKFNPGMSVSLTSSCALCRLLARSLPNGNCGTINYLDTSFIGTTQTLEGSIVAAHCLKDHSDGALRILPLGDDAFMLGRTPNGYARKVDPRIANREIMRSWLVKCETQHAECKRRKPWISVEGIAAKYLIDVQDMCLRDVGRQNLTYFALSYVWGKAEMMFLLRENLYLLLKPGSLLTCGRLPRVVQDAITVTRELSHRYLWVDALCIVQDNLGDKPSQIAAMNEIYKGAYLTLVAIHANDASSSLPGVEPYPTPRHQHLERIAGMRMTTTWPPLQEIFEGDDCIWNKRAWTYQEDLFSRRMLYFSRHQVYFSCLQSTCSEDLYESGSDVEHESWFTSHPGRYLYVPPEDKMKFTIWKRYVQEFSIRKHTFPVDRYHAFSGIASEQEERWQLPSLMGIPVQRLILYLLWRHKELPYQEYPDGVQRIPEWPTWSWCGWTGPVEFPQLNSHYNQQIRAVTAAGDGQSYSWKYDAEGNLTDKEPKNKKPRRSSESRARPRGHSSHLDMEDGSNDSLLRLHSEEVDSIQSYVEPGGKLTIIFYASCTLVPVDVQPFAEEGYLAISPAPGKICGILYTARNALQEDQMPFKCFCILLGTSRRYLYFHRHNYRPSAPDPVGNQLTKTYLRVTEKERSSLISRSWKRTVKRRSMKLPNGGLFITLLYVVLFPIAGILILSVVGIICLALQLVSVAGGIIVVILGIPSVIVLFSICFLFLWLSKSWNTIAHVMWVEHREGVYERIAVGEMSYRCWQELHPEIKKIELG